MNLLQKLIPSIALVLACSLLASVAQAVSPPPDGGYPGGNTAEGQSALFSLTNGGYNTAVGYLSLRNNATNSFNTALGAGALLADTADGNTAIGAAALLSNTTGSFNTANGAFALFSNTGDDNTATGEGALLTNTTGGSNTADGANALSANITGFENTAIGHQALNANNVGTNNTAVGAGALSSNTTGVNNIAIGSGAGNNITTATNVICIGAGVSGFNVSNTAWIGNVYGVITQSGTTAPVVISNQGQLGTVSSSKRFKKDIATMERASEAILSLRPVTFHYKTDTNGTPQFGLIAEEVAKVNPALVLPDRDGKPYTVRYDQVNAMLLNEFLKEHQKVEQQQATIVQLKDEIEAIVAHSKEQDLELQTVRHQIKASRSETRIAITNQ